MDLSVGTPVDPTPAVVQHALCEAADSPGYPTTIGRVDTRQACLDWLSRRHGVVGLGLDAVLPVVGSKELIASLAGHLGIGSGDLVAYPELAYPTYEVGAVLAGARAVATDSLTSLGPETPALLWLNSPSNPTGRVLPPAHLRKVVDWCRERGTILSPTSATSSAPGTRTRSRCCTRRSPAGRPRDPDGPLALEAVQPRRLPVRLRRGRPRAWSASCSRCARTSGCRCPRPSRPR
ncbi:aminotransferase class I/II-fold pyridoxal phosphate-dependent enzyme [Nocardioides ungokensis]|uniref:aminotransferase class I/II-fold pyridoxal phosphate-dependent enzyme n=1 Tax=Nocardioides ungokensis TaxID=1643322 RepID=UPI0031B5AED1